MSTPHIPSKPTSELAKIGNQVLHALNNSGHIAPSSPYRRTITLVLQYLRTHYGITPSTPPSDPDFELPLIVHLIQTHHHTSAAQRSRASEPIPLNAIDFITHSPLAFKLLLILLPFILCSLVLWLTWSGPTWLTLLLLLTAWNVGRYGPALLIRLILPLTLILLILTGCTTRLADLTIASTKNIDIKRTLHRVDETTRTTGIDKRHMVIFIPLGIPNMKEACDKAIEKHPHCVGLSNATIKHTWWYIPYIYGQFWYTVEGNPIYEATTP